MIDIPVLVLAAGASARFGSDKLMTQVAGQPLLAWTLEAAIDVVPIDHVLVVLGPAQDERQALCEAAGVATIVAARADRGMRWSLQAGLEQCPQAAPGAVIVLADDPMALRALPGIVATARRTPTVMAAVRRTGAAPHPVYLPRAAWPGPLIDPEDSGLRELLEDDACTWVEDLQDAPIDVDLPGDMERLAAAMRAPQQRDA